MNERLLLALRARRSLLHEGWVTRLRATPSSSALAHPDTLIHRMNRTLDEIFIELSISTPRKRQPTLPPDLCECGRNPWLAYFATAALTFQHVLALCVDEMPITPEEVDQVDRAVTRVARREIIIFCALCRRKNAVRPSRECVPDKQSGLHLRPCETPD